MLSRTFRVQGLGLGFRGLEGLCRGLYRVLHWGI